MRHRDRLRASSVIPVGVVVAEEESSSSAEEALSIIIGFLACESRSCQLYRRHTRHARSHGQSRLAAEHHTTPETDCSQAEAGSSTVASRFVSSDALEAARTKREEEWRDLHAKLGQVSLSPPSHPSTPADVGSGAGAAAVAGRKGL